MLMSGIMWGDGGGKNSSFQANAYETDLLMWPKGGVLWFIDPVQHSLHGL